MNMLIKIKSIFILSVLVITLSATNVVNAGTINDSTLEKKLNWIDFGVGQAHSLAIKEDGSVWAWGYDSSGQLGTGKPLGFAKEPIQVKGIKEVVSVAAGQVHSLALKKDGTVWAWGENTTGQLGNGTITKWDDSHKTIIENHNSAVPVQVKGLSHIIQIATDLDSSYALKDDGTVWAWGLVISDQDGDIARYSAIPIQIRALSDIVSISAANLQIMVLKKDGTVWTWGINYNGQLGNGKADTRIKGESLVNSTTQTKPSKIENLINIQSIALGQSYAVALKNDGTIWAWGKNNSGQLGDGTNTDRYNPVQITGITDVISIAASAGGTIYLKADGTIWANGDNYLPAPLKGMIRVTKIAAVGISNFVMVLKENHTLWSWTDNGFGRDTTGDVGKFYTNNEPGWIKSYDSQKITKDRIVVMLNDHALVFDEQPVLINNRTMVPLRKIFESLGAEIKWNQATSTVTATKGLKVVKLTIGSTMGKINDLEVPLDAAAVVVNGRTMVPVRFIVTAFDAKTTWDDVTKTVKIQAE